MKEVWKKLRGWKSYQISNTGKIRSVDRVVKTARNPDITRVKTGIVRKQVPNSGNGYMQVRLMEDPQDQIIYVKDEVMKHFGPARPSRRYRVGHISDDYTDCSISNLEWRTQSESAKKADHKKVRLPMSYVRHLRRYWLTRCYTSEVLALMFKIDIANINNILYGVTYKDPSYVPYYPSRSYVKYSPQIEEYLATCPLDLTEPNKKALMSLMDINRDTFNKRIQHITNTI